MMFKRPSCLQGRRDDGSSKNNKSSGGDDWSAFPVRQLFVLGMLNDAQESFPDRQTNHCQRSVASVNQLHSCPFSLMSITWSSLST